ncbi:hypothetical protein Ocin01_11835 [Orchesella cincta]|uniref:Uncharacterized protein n=1 Tax=Orchesella cincta TaxID=48709 RepID=A0A1D2MQ13_ORCCI|nr:hypothetical protein Ocin01_11835 [Orchesella cincta]
MTNHDVPIITSKSDGKVITTFRWVSTIKDERVLVFFVAAVDCLQRVLLPSIMARVCRRYICHPILLLEERLSLDPSIFALNPGGVSEKSRVVATTLLEMGQWALYT